jgi:hypothetical protein
MGYGILMQRIEERIMSDQEKPVHWLEDKIDAEQGLCTLNSTDKQYRCYCKFDEMIHFWFYGDEYGFNCDTGEYGIEARGTGHHEYYWCIGGVEELDKAIAQLQSIKTSAAEWYAKRGKQWPPDWDAYVKGDKTWEQALTLESKQHERQ